MKPQLSYMQQRLVLESLKQYGEMPLAANAAAVTVGHLRRCIDADEDFAEEVEHARSLHGSAMVLWGQKIVQKGGDGAVSMLKTLLEARVEGFSKESRERAKPSGRPEALRLRQFDDEGNEVTDTTEKPAKILQLPCEKVF